MSEPKSSRGPPSLMESRPKRRSVPASSAVPAPTEDSTEDSQVRVMGNVVESLRRMGEEASTRRQLLVLRSTLEREIRETEVQVVSDEEPTEKPTEVPTEEPTEKPTEVPTEEPTEKPTEVPTEEPTEKPTEKPTGKPIEEDEDDDWGRWKGSGASSSAGPSEALVTEAWHATAQPKSPAYGPSADAVPKEEERERARRYARESAEEETTEDPEAARKQPPDIWYNPEEKEEVAPKTGKKKRRKKRVVNEPVDVSDEMDRRNKPSHSFSTTRTRRSWRRPCYRSSKEAGNGWLRLSTSKGCLWSRLTATPACAPPRLQGLGF